MIPENKQDAVTKALRTAFHSDAFEDIQQLTKGLSGSLVFKIIVHQKPYLLRIVMREDSRDNPSYYFNCLRAAADAELAPRIHYLNVDEKISITDYIDDRYFPLPEARIKMPDAIRNLHTLPKFANQLNYLEASDGFLQRFLAAKLVPKNEIQDLLDAYERIGMVYPRNDEANLVSCHNDVKRDNIIFDGVRPWLVDWEAARLIDRYVDLVAAANFIVRNEDDETEFLKRYFGESFDEYKQARFFLMKQMVHMFCFTLCTIFGSGGRPVDLNMSMISFHEFHDLLWNGKIDLGDNTEKLKYALVHINEFRINMKTARFEDALRIVGG